MESRKGENTFDTDEQPGLAKPQKIPSLRPAFQKDGTITAANASSISDGAAALVLAPFDETSSPLAFIEGHATHAQDPEWFTTAPVEAIRKLLEKTSWKADEVDLWEINEAFAVVTMAAIHDLKLDPARVNVNGGATALGHPIGCSGARIVVTLLHEMIRRDAKKGIAGICIGGGEATAIALTRPAGSAGRR